MGMGKGAWLAAASAITIAAASGAAGQTANGGPPPGASVTNAGEGAQPARLDAISVTATRNPVRAFDYPGMVSVVRSGDMAMRQGSTPDDVLGFVPNVQFIGGPRRTGETPSFRGFDGADIVILFDGARQNFGSAHDGRFFIDPSFLKSVEVLRGPASSLYGSGATGGASSSGPSTAPISSTMARGPVPFFPRDIRMSTARVEVPGTFFLSSSPSQVTVRG